jgi:phosphate transport system substrate-binding protein
MITNSDAKGAYPISCFTWIIIYKEQNYSGRNKEQAEETVKLIAYMMSNEAQKKTTAVNYAPLPKAAIEKSIKNLKTITYNGEVLYK